MTQIEMDVARSTIRANREIADHLSNVGWEQRRYELAKAAISGVAATDLKESYIATMAVRYADAVIAELKKPINNDK